MRTTEFTIKVRTPGSWDFEAFEQALDQFMEQYPLEFEDWKINTFIIPKQWDTTDWRKATAGE